MILISKLCVIYLLVSKFKYSLSFYEYSSVSKQNELNKQIFPFIVNSTHFACDNNTKIFPLERINDDYCDCDDASDENMTNACVNGRFKCTNALYYPKVIYTSQLNDNVCDCCDGSDEEDNNIRTLCRSKCLQQSKSEFAKLENNFITLSKVISSYSQNDNEKYFSYHKRIVVNFIKKFKEQQMLIERKNIIYSYIRKVEIHLTEEEYNEDYIDKNEIPLKNLHALYKQINSKIGENENFLNDNKILIDNYIQFGILKELSNDCIELKYNLYKCELCDGKLQCRRTEKHKKPKSIQLGKLSHFEGNVAHFKEGGKCKNYNVPIGAEIKIACGYNEEFKLIRKENKCLYKFVYYTKIGCNTYQLKEIYNKINDILE